MSNYKKLLQMPFSDSSDSDENDNSKKLVEEFKKQKSNNESNLTL